MNNKKFLVVNSGSSSLKFTLYEMPNGNEIVNGLIEKIGETSGSYTLKYNGNKIENTAFISSHIDAVKIMINELLKNKFINDVSEINGIGHRVLHGGEIYSNSVVIDDIVLSDIKMLTKLGPLHHPGEIAIIESMQAILPNIPQVAVFDTAFHQTMPEENYMYAIPNEWYKKNGVRKYGFHGTSHKYITNEMKDYFNKDDVNLIVCHIGSGASISCIKNGNCYDTSMGLTPLDGLIMGTRSGTIDPSIVEYICKEEKLDVVTVTEMLNKQSGLKGISGKNDFRDIEILANKGDENAQLAIKMFRNSIIKYIAQYYFELEGKIDALVFTAGIGENAIKLRGDIVNSISSVMGVNLDIKSNDNISKFKEYKSGLISTINSNFEIFVLPTNEEYMILKDTYELCKNIENKLLLKTNKIDLNGM